MDFSSLALDVLLVLSLVYFVNQLVQQRRAPLPPGPRGIPWLGNVLQWPKEKYWLTFSRWGRKYGAFNLGMEYFIDSLCVQATLCA